jgi:hypothetical protein
VPAQLTDVMWATFIPAGLFGAWVSNLRASYFSVTVVKKFKAASHAQKPHEIHEFTDSRDVEVRPASLVRPAHFLKGGPFGAALESFVSVAAR